MLPDFQMPQPRSQQNDADIRNGNIVLKKDQTYLPLFIYPLKRGKNTHVCKCHNFLSLTPTAHLKDMNNWTARLATTGFDSDAIRCCHFSAFHEKQQVTTKNEKQRRYLFAVMDREPMFFVGRNMFPTKCKHSITRLKSPTTSTNMLIERSTVNPVKFGNVVIRIWKLSHFLHTTSQTWLPPVHGCCTNPLFDLQIRVPFGLHSILTWTSICRPETKSMYSWFAMSCIRSTKHVSPKPVHVASHDAPDAVRKKWKPCRC